MRALRSLLILSLFAAIPVQADAGQGTGALVFRGNDGWYVGYYWDDSVAGARNVLYFSTVPDWGEAYFCGEPEPPYDGVRWQQVVMPSPGILQFKLNFKSGGPHYARVLYLDPDTDIPWDNLCDFIRGPVFHNPIAEGIVQLHVSDLNSCNFGTGRNTWFWHISGEVVDLRGAGACKSGVVHVMMLEHWMMRNGVAPNPDCSYAPEDFVSVKFTPPTLTCEK